MAKARILVDGTVQDVGYRVIVKRLAKANNIKGLVRNLDDGRVEIYCEGNKDDIEQLKKVVDIKGDPNDIFSLNVGKIEVYWEGENGYSPAWKEYKLFEIDYGESEPYKVERETLESLEVAKLGFSRLQGEVVQLRYDSNENFAKLGEGIESLRRDSNENFKMLNENMGAFRTETNNNFDSMARKYGSISKEVTATKKELKKSMDGLKNSIDSLPERMTNALLKGLKSEKPDS